MLSSIQPFENVPKIFIDPLYEQQRYCLVSFIPSANATPDADGIFGMSKVRGVFQTAQEANDRAEWLIRNHDQNTTILTTYVGRPYPICADTKKYIEETNSVDLQTKINTTLREEAKEKRVIEQKAMNEIKEREKELVADTESQRVEDPFEHYTMLRVKRAHLIHTVLEYNEKMNNIKKILVECTKEINESDKTTDFKTKYLDRYNKAIEEVGCKFNNSETFMKYLDDDRDLEEILK
jgi:hypothetical protein